MIIDTWVLIAILCNEPEAVAFEEKLAAGGARMSVANWLEAAMVAEGSQGAVLAERLDRLVEVADIELVPVTEGHARRARAAFRRYGRGSGSPARLNFGDCFAYALSAESGEPLLFKGDDFTHTDVLKA